MDQVTTLDSRVNQNWIQWSKSILFDWSKPSVGVGEADSRTPVCRDGYQGEIWRLRHG